MIEMHGRRYFVLDAHTHMGEGEMLKRFGLPSSYWEDEMIAAMDAAGVDAVVTFPLGAPGTDNSFMNHGVLKAQSRYPNRIIAYARIIPAMGEKAVEDLKRYIALGARGVKFHPFRDGAYVVNDRSIMAPLFHVIAEAGLPVLFHTGEAWNCTPALVADLARDFPSVPIIIAHMGMYGYHAEALAVAERYENLYLETSALWPPAIVRAAVSKIGKERVLFGSDHPTCPFGYEIDKVLKYADLTEDETAHVLGLNMARLLGIRLRENIC